MSEASTIQPATRLRRLFAKIIDFLVVPIVALILIVVFGLYEHAEDYVGLRPYVSALFAGVLSYLLINGWLMRQGQTLGKRLLNLVVCTSADQPAGFAVMFGRGLFFPLLYLTFLPPLTIIPLIDFACGLRKDRKCLHDLICRTEVRC